MPMAMDMGEWLEDALSCDGFGAGDDDDSVGRC